MGTPQPAPDLQSRRGIPLSLCSNRVSAPPQRLLGLGMPNLEMPSWSRAVMINAAPMTAWEERAYDPRMDVPRDQAAQEIVALLCKGGQLDPFDIAMELQLPVDLVILVADELAASGVLRAHV